MLDGLGSRLPAVAARSGLTSAELTTLLLTDSTARVRYDRVLFLDGAVPADPGRAAQATAVADQPGQTFLLHSLPGSKHSIYLDVDGADVSDTAWNDGTLSGVQAGLDQDGDPTTFDAAEQALVQDVWRRVAEDYAPLDVDVTTQDPGAAALSRTDAADPTYGTRVVITSSDAAYAAACGSTCGGVAFMNVFSAVNGQLMQPAWVFTQAVGSTYGKYIAEAAAHEAGHNLGLSHDGGPGTPYDAGQGGWAPIMGVGYYQPLTTFSNGDYAGANNHQDDYAVMARAGAPLRTDDDPDVRPVAATGTVAGVLEARGDTDRYSVDVPCAGVLSVRVTPAATSPDLDLRLTLQDAAGRVVATADPASATANPDTATGLDAALQPTTAAGRYTVTVRGTGRGDPLGTGYSDYGIRGAYTLAVAACTATAPAAPAGLTVAATSAGAATVSWSPPASDGGSAVTQYRVSATAPGEALSASTRPGVRSASLALRPGVSYAVQVRAVNAVGAGPAATTSFVLPARPSAPRIGTPVAGTAGGPVTATATWAAPVSGVATGYTVYASRVGGTGSTASPLLGAGARSYVMALPQGSWTFTVVAASPVGSSVPSARSGQVTAR